MKRFPIFIRSLLCLLLISGAWRAQAGILDAVQVRAKADAPLEADQAGYEVTLIDTHSDLLVAGEVVVPEGFGKVDAAGLTFVDPEGQQVGFVELAPDTITRKKSAYDFHLRKDYLKNSTLTLGHFTPGGC